MKAIARKTGKEPVLLEGVTRVPGGIIRVMELQEGARLPVDDMPV